MQTNVNIEGVFTELTTQILNKGSYHVRQDQEMLSDQIFGQEERGSKCGAGCGK